MTTRQWKLKPNVSDARFKFAPPKGAEPVEGQAYGPAGREAGAAPAGSPPAAPDSPSQPDKKREKQP